MLLDSSLEWEQQPVINLIVEVPDAFDCINLITKTIDSLENIKELSDLLNIIKDLKDKAVVCENTADEGTFKII